MIKSIVCCIFLFTSVSYAAVENLDEVMARKSRLSSVTWGYSLLENASNNYTWQPETLNYYDVTTGNEVWRVTYTPAQMGGENQDIAATHWSANGKRLMIHSLRPSNAFAYATGTNKIWMYVDSDGSKLRPALGSAAQTATGDTYAAWSPILADVHYGSKTNDGQSGLSYNTLYKVSVSDTTISRAALVSITGTITASFVTKKGISGDGSTMVLKVIDNGVNKLYPLTIYPEANKAELITGGYARMLNFDQFWGTTTLVPDRYHDTYLSGAKNGVDGIWNYLMLEQGTPSVSNSDFWRARITNAAGTGAPVHVQDHAAPYDWGGEVEPVNTRASMVGSEKDPWCSLYGITAPANTDCAQYPGHVSPDRWGHYTIYEQNTVVPANTVPYGLAHYDVRDHKFKSIMTTMQNGNHTDWEAWSDWSVSDGSALFANSWNGTSGVKRIYTQNYLDTNSVKEVAYTHANYNAGSTSAQSYLGPIQSPDGTKVQFVTSFLNSSDTHHQLFWATAYYPYPPEIKSASKVSSNVRLTWDFNQGSSCASQSTSATRTGPTPNYSTPRTYATRGWPHETLDCPPSPREIKQFRVWVSTDNTTWTPVGTTTYNNCSGANECGMWTETAWTYDYAQANSTTRYYAVTALEHSGLESRTLSNSWKVITDGSGAVTSQAQQSAYPSNPGGKTAFYTTAPAQPVAPSTTPTGTAGQSSLVWTAPADTLVRHYNIYALDGSAPTAVQQRRIASTPATAPTAYVDWLGDPAGTTLYGITSVDYQGNESAIVSASSAAVHGACGSVSGTTVSSLTSDSANLCTGTVASFSGTGGWTWGCNGINGGTSTAAGACTATLSVVPSTGSATIKASGRFTLR